MLVSDAMQQLLLTFSGWQNVSSRALMVSAMDAHRRDALEDACSVFCSHTANERKRQKDAKRERERGTPPKENQETCNSEKNTAVSRQVLRCKRPSGMMQFPIMSNLMQKPCPIGMA